MFSHTPIFDRLVAERGDIPAQVRAEAEGIQRDLARIIQAPPIGGGPLGRRPFSADGGSASAFL
ncbi:hypothetical protein ABZX85_21155 [Streptomyces sp. NPDC004539]|uniref:hypothetical protein n=1 Tax=Streptomyces sp. NPDC004539 TaxID=3154280 RepID=UPI0033A4BE8A